MENVVLHPLNVTAAKLKGNLLSLLLKNADVISLADKIETYHQVLKCLLSIKDPTGKLARWSLKLLHIIYDPGKQQGNADALSRIIYCNIATIVIPQKYPKEIRETQSKKPETQNLIRYLESKVILEDQKDSSKMERPLSFGQQ